MRRASLFRRPGRGVLHLGLRKILAPRFQIGTKLHLMAADLARGLWHIAQRPARERTRVAGLRDIGTSGDGVRAGKGRTVASDCTAELLECATLPERDPHFWETEFAWLLAHP